MKWSIEYQEKLQFAVITYEGQLVVEDCIKAIAELLFRDFWQPGSNLLVDCRRVAFKDIGLDDLRKVLDFHRTKNELIGTGKVAVMVDSLCHYGIARQYELLAADLVHTEIMVFRDEVETVRWLVG